MGGNHGSEESLSVEPDRGLEALLVGDPLRGRLREMGTFGSNGDRRKRTKCVLLQGVIETRRQIHVGCSTQKTHFNF